MESLRVFDCCGHRGKVCQLFLFSILIVWLNGVCEARSPSLHLKDNGYQNLVVAISNSIDTDAQLLEELKNLLTRSSHELFVATKQHVYFKDITILLSPAWAHVAGAVLFQQITCETFQEADVQIEVPNRQNTPYTKQYAGCGERSLSIHLSPDFILSTRNESNSASNAKKLVRQWAYYQYGVFEECGYANDDLYPQFYYHHDHQLEVTGCLQPHAYTFGENCSVPYLSAIPGSRCEFSPTKGIADANTSILNRPSLERVNRFCDSPTHNPEAPTQQNFLCREKSAWSVITSDTDFANTSPLSDSNFDTTPTFRFVLASNETYVVLLDQSNPMKENNKFEAVQPVLTRFFNDHVPAGSFVAFTSFSNDATINHPGILVEDGPSRSSLVSVIPENVQIAHLANIEAGILTATRIFSTPTTTTLQNNTRKVLILITAGKWEPMRATEMCDALNEAGARAMIVVCSDDDEPLDSKTTEALYRLAKCTRGNVFNIPGISPTDYPLLVERLDAAVRSTLIPNEMRVDDVQILMKHFAGTTTDATVSGNFVIDKTISDSVFRVSYEKTDKNVEKVTLTRPDGMIDDHLLFEKEPFGPARTYHFKDVQSGLWRYEIKLYEQFKNSSVTVALSAKSKRNAAISVRCWTNVRAVDDDDAPPAVILYAEVVKMNAPVIGANVVATVSLPSTPTSPSRSHRVSLFDNGNGDPDVAENDGIYSRYFIELPASGFYHVQVDVEGVDDDMTRVYGSRAADLDESADCRRPAYVASATGKFSRFAVGPSFYVSRASNDIVYRPNRISDLRIHKVNPWKKQIELQWSPVGEKLDWGELPISRYEIRASRIRENLHAQNFEKADRVDVTVVAAAPLLANKNRRLTAVVNVTSDDTLYYFAIRTIDRVSNIVSAFLPPSGSSESTTINSTHLSDQTERPHKSTFARAGPIIGIVMAVVLVIVIVVVVWWVTKNRRRRGKETIHDNAHDSEQVPVVNESMKPIGEESEALIDNEDETSENSPIKKPEDDDNSEAQKPEEDSTPNHRPKTENVDVKPENLASVEQDDDDDLL